MKAKILTLSLFWMLMIPISSYTQVTEFLLIRHGETDWNAGFRYQGHANIPLNQNGHAQAHTLAEALEKNHPDITIIYSSDLDRAQETAHPIARRLKLAIIPNEQFRERNWGVLEGQYNSDPLAVQYGRQEQALDAKYPDFRERWKMTSIPDAETFDQVRERVKRELARLATQHPGQKVAIFTHGGVIRTLIIDITDDPSRRLITNCEVAHFTYDSEKPNQPWAFKQSIY